MVDRDGPGANFVDFNAEDLERYLAKKESLDAEPDFEGRNLGPEALSEDAEQANAAAPPPSNWRSAGPGGLSEEMRKFLIGLKEKASGLSPEDLVALESLAGQRPLGPG